MRYCNRCSFWKAENLHYLRKKGVHNFCTFKSVVVKLLHCELEDYVHFIKRISFTAYAYLIAFSIHLKKKYLNKINVNLKITQNR